MSRDAADTFHAHLDACARCREQPFNLCPDGSTLLAKAALDPLTSAPAVDLRPATIVEHDSDDPLVKELMSCIEEIEPILRRRNPQIGMNALLKLLSHGAVRFQCADTILDALRQGIVEMQELALKNAQRGDA